MITHVKIWLKYVIISLSIICLVFGQDINVLSKTVVFLQKEVQAYEMKSGKKVEVWYKNVSTKKFEPKYFKYSGTGFIINHNGRDYVVTANHVANFMDINSQILFNTSNDSSIDISINFIRKSHLLRNAKWFSHPQADITLHPIVYPTTKIDQLHISTKEIIKEDKVLNLLTDIIILGFPLGLGVNKTLNPIANMAHVASDIITIDDPNIDPTLRFYLLDQPLHRDIVALLFSIMKIFLQVSL